MAAVFNEAFAGRLIRGGDSAEISLKVVITETDNEIEAAECLIANVPGQWGDLPLTQYTLEQIGNNEWEGEATYRAKDFAGNDSVVQSFDTTGGTAHIYVSKETIGSYAVGGAGFPYFEGAINANGDSVEGIDIPAPEFNLVIRRIMTRNDVINTYYQTVFNLTAKVNDRQWRGFQKGEVLFLGGRSSLRLDGMAEVELLFKCSKNMAGIKIGKMTGIVKRGWEYLWVYFIDVQNSTGTGIIKKPLEAYVERIFDYGNLDQLGVS